MLLSSIGLIVVPLTLQTVGGAEECSVCKSVVTTVESELESAKVKNWLKSEVLSLCSYLGSYSATCQTDINTYFDVVYQIILGYLVSVSLVP